MMRPGHDTRLTGVNGRHFLRGTGVSIALPLLESMLPARVLAAPSETARFATTASGAPLRTAFIFFPNGAIPSAWWPNGEGTEFKWSRTLESLAPSKKSVQV